MNPPHRRIAIAALIATLLVVVFAALGGVGFAQGSTAAAQYQPGKKITICHKKKNTISISVNAWPAHKAHGDTTGACANQNQTKKNKGTTQASAHGNGK